jgi:cytochrome P450
MPYLCAVDKEVLRWRPTVPLMPQRVLVEDLDLEGYQFPTGTQFLVSPIFVCSHWYEILEEFRPERWSVYSKSVSRELWHFVFSAGIRSCVEYKLAQKELFFSFSRLLYCFGFTPIVRSMIHSSRLLGKASLFQLMYGCGV